MNGNGMGTFGESRKHVGHKMAVVDEVSWARLVCVDCGITIATSDKDDAFAHDRWAGHRDAVADSLGLADYAALDDPDSPAFPEHWVVCVAYGDPAEPVNVAVECEHCGTVLADWDAPS